VARVLAVLDYWADVLRWRPMTMNIVGGVGETLTSFDQSIRRISIFTFAP
jgi:hypothetical protein